MHYPGKNITDVAINVFNYFILVYDFITLGVRLPQVVTTICGTDMLIQFTTINSNLLTSHFIIF